MQHFCTNMIKLEMIDFKATNPYWKVKGVFILVANIFLIKDIFGNLINCMLKIENLGFQVVFTEFYMI